MRGDRTLTTSDLCALMPDVSKATIYRHVDHLATGGVLETVAELRVRGAVERTYRLRQSRAAITPEMLESLSPDDYRRAFVVATTVLLAEFDAYLDRADADPTADLVGFRQHMIWLDHDELAALIEDLRKVILPRLANTATPARARYLLSPILFPVESRPE